MYPGATPDPSSVIRKTTDLTKKTPKYHSKTSGQNHSCLLQKKRKHSQWVSATLGIEIQQEPLHLP